MEMILTTMAFFALTALLTVRHLKRTESAPPAHSPQVVGAACLRCDHLIPDNALYCPGCGVSRQVYELVNAKASAAEAANAPAGGKPHAMVRADVCVGCGSCVAACPEPGALSLQGHLAVVNKAACVGHGECIAECPVSAIVMTTGAAVHRVEVPHVGAGFQSNVPGLYVVGELGGRGLIKNAINEGALAVEHIVRELSPGELRTLGGDEALDVVVVGSGPAGLSAGLSAHLAGLSYVVLEQGDLAESVRQYPRHKILLAESSRSPLYGRLWVGSASKETLLSVWGAIIAENALKIRTGRRVEEITRSGASFLVRCGTEFYRARRVVLAMGRRGTPRRLGVPGEELPNVFYDIVDMEDFAGRRVVVVGGGDSAAESALGLANQDGTVVHLVHRGESFDKLQPSLSAKLEKAVSQGRVTPILSARVVEIKESSLVLAVGDRLEHTPYDDVIIRVGGEAASHMLEALGVRIISKDIPLHAAEEALAS